MLCDIPYISAFISVKIIKGREFDCAHNVTVGRKNVINCIAIPLPQRGSMCAQKTKRPANI